jgi:uncharacterized protein (DUF1501 family)
MDLPANFSQQLLAIAKVIEARSTLGASRQVFLATFGSFDTHTNQLNEQQALFSQLDLALTASMARWLISARAAALPRSLSRISPAISSPIPAGARPCLGSHSLVIGGAVNGG